ncbi:hypothetical protein SAMN06265173_1073 [Thalassovita litoralis]|uniref:Uncharacterized protein n=1 Tax=Thalassovita litoralis TaxID=1010611 RepID=A0A521CJX5_9RHOB|nr:hypothetical protein SAMN06265173_1073 [Thalassovita litoralis]
MNIWSLSGGGLASLYSRLGVENVSSAKCRLHPALQTFTFQKCCTMHEWPVR